MTTLDANRRRPEMTAVECVCGKSMMRTNRLVAGDRCRVCKQKRTPIPTVDPLQCSPLLRSVDTGGGSSFPLVVNDGEHDSLEWILRYGSAEDVVAVRMQAASIVEAYEALIGKTDARRRAIVRLLKVAIAKEKRR